MKKLIIIGIMLIIGCSVGFRRGKVIVENKVAKVYVMDSVEVSGRVCGEMVEVVGEYCTRAKEVCEHWIDGEKRYPMMCGKFREPTKCVGGFVKMRYCIDKYESMGERGDLPEVFIDWNEAKEKCASVGKRLCDIREMTLACEGPGMKPYPYGYVRDVKKCNIGHQWIDPDNNAFAKVDKRVRSGVYSGCVSDYGVFDLAGNTDEWGFNSTGNINKAPYQSALFGGHYVNGVRNRCRDNGVPSVTVSHGPGAKNYEMSYRCCRDVR